MPPAAAQRAQVTASQEGEGCVLTLTGTWQLTAPRPAVSIPKGGAWVRPRLDGVDAWDSSLVLWLERARARADELGIQWLDTDLPEALRALAAQKAAAQPLARPATTRHGPLTQVGLASNAMADQAREMTHFVGEVVLGTLAVARNPKKFRMADALWEMQQCGANALPIVSLISFLVGVTLAYTGAIILRQYGGDIYVADLVGLSMVREMGAMMTAVVLAGRTGAAFAAQLANMKANEEVDAYVTFGFSPFDFLVFPRILALGLMMPMLALYANLLGVLGGMLIAMLILNIPPMAYFVEMATTVGLMDITTGLIKATTFGLLVGMAGCFHGLRAEPNAAGVGRAATSAVVMGILLVIVADALYAVVFNALGW